MLIVVKSVAFEARLLSFSTAQGYIVLVTYLEEGFGPMSD